MAQKAYMSPIALQPRMVFVIQSAILACLQVIPIQYSLPVQNDFDIRIKEN